MDNRAYGDFAYLYDMFMQDTPYEEWCAFIVDALKDAGIDDGLVLDLGCGTGRLTRMLSDKGYDMIGVDSSPEMLDIASEDAVSRGILYLCQDMREFELYGTVRAIVSVYDSINYITDPEELLKVFKLVNNYLDPGGLFICDFNTEYKYREILKDNTIADTLESAAFIWDNIYDPESRINEYDITFFAAEEDGRFRRFSECHYQRAYTLEEIKDLVEKSGMIFEAAYDDYSDRAPDELSERITFICRENGK